MNNDMLPAGTTFHINPEDIKWEQNGDLISREALKEAFKAWKNMDDYYHDTDCNDIPLSEAFDLIDNAPTVETKTTYDVNRAYDRGYITAMNAYARPKGDLISRQDAIDALEEQLDYLQMLNKNENPTAEGKWYGVNWARNTIADLPYKQNERPKGEWLRTWNIDEFTCDKCRSLIKQPTLMGQPSYTFCPNCGAEMRKGGAV